jgi:hypothetical protein
VKIVSIQDVDTKPSRFQFYTRLNERKYSVLREKNAGKKPARTRRLEKYRAAVPVIISVRICPAIIAPRTYVMAAGA